MEDTRICGNQDKRRTSTIDRNKTINLLDKISEKPNQIITRATIHAENRLNHTPINVVNKLTNNKIQKTVQTQQSDWERIENYEDTPRQSPINQQEASVDEYISFNVTPRSHLQDVNLTHNRSRASINGPVTRDDEFDNEFIHRLNNLNNNEPRQSQKKYKRQPIENSERERAQQIKNDEALARRYEQLERNYGKMNLQLEQERKQRIEAEKRQKRQMISQHSVIVTKKPNVWDKTLTTHTEKKAGEQIISKIMNTVISFPSEQDHIMIIPINEIGLTRAECLTK